MATSGMTKITVINCISIQRSISHVQCTVYKFQNQYATHVGEMRSRQWNIPVLKYAELHNCITDQKYQNKKIPECIPITLKGIQNDSGF